jgi:hypothetical protein
VHPDIHIWIALLRPAEPCGDESIRGFDVGACMRLRMRCRIEDELGEDDARLLSQRSAFPSQQGYDAGHRQAEGS